MEVREEVQTAHAIYHGCMRRSENHGRGIEHTRSRVQCRTGLKDPGQNISFRFGETQLEAYNLKTGLEQRGLKVFLSDLLPGANLDAAIYDALDTCRLAVLMAGETYGRQTTSFSTYHELDFVLDEQKPFYLIKMCERWQEAHVRGKFGKRTMFKMWMPGDPMPDDLLDDIAAKLQRTEISIRFDMSEMSKLSEVSQMTEASQMTATSFPATASPATARV